MMFADPFPDISKDGQTRGVELLRLLGRVAQAHGLLFWLDDGDGHLHLDANWKRALGVTSDIVPAFATWSLVHPEDRPRASLAWETSKRRGDRIDVMLRIRTSQGHHVRAHITGQPWPASFPLRYIGTCQLAGVEQPLRHITGQELKAARALVGLSVGQLAHLSTVSIATIARLEASLNVRRHNQIKIIDALGRLGVEMSRDPDGGFYMRLRPNR